MFFLAGLDSLRKLHSLNLSHNQLITSRGLSDVTTLQEVDLSNNHLQNLDSLEDLPLLQSLRAASNNLMQVSLFDLWPSKNLTFLDRFNAKFVFFFKNRCPSCPIKCF